MAWASGRARVPGSVMSPRLPFLFFFLTTAGVLAACKSSSPYGTPANAAIGTGIAVGAAAVNRAVTGECWAACRPGTICDKTSGLCVEPGHAGWHTGASPPPGSSATRPPPTLQAEPYPAGHEYEVPSVSASSNEPVACDPATMHATAADAGPIACQPDGSLLNP
jgi:hypothetical protein